MLIKNHIGATKTAPGWRDYEGSASLSNYFILSDTFASRTAALQDQWADSSIGNVTGSNAVNVFLGIGIGWRDYEGSGSLSNYFILSDTFASRTAALQDQWADSSIGNVTGSNAVNVFLGIGIAWAIAAIYHALNGSEFHVHAGSLAFSVTMFLIGSTLCIFILQYRRFSYIKGELGGPLKMKIFSALIFICIWILYLLFSTLEAYCIISGF
uniref:Na_Ca_ex domain-containing protein n=1 Tax=Ascaris lumbricoides TaxID=6252 RepID=A0A0M3IBA4_ASCLU